MIAKLVPWVPLLVACNGDSERGHYFDITLAGADDECTSDPVSYEEKIEYRLVVDGQAIELAVGPDVFATGTVNGCELVYTSVLWTEDRGEARISWQIQGSARVNLDGGCPIESGGDWEGTETFEIISSDEPALQPGCEYGLDVTGTHLREEK